MSYTIEILNMSNINKTTWNEFLLRYKYQVTVFHTQEWMQVLHDACGYNPKYIVARSKTGLILAAIPFMIDTRFGIKNYFSMPYDTYGGVIGDNSIISDLTHTFLHLPGIGMRYYVDYKRLDQDGTGFVRTRVSTHLIDISMSLDDILKHMSKHNQKLILSLLKDKTITCNIAQNEEELQIVKDLFRPNINIHGGGLAPEFVDAIYKYMIPDGYCRPYLTKVDGVPVCASLFFIYDNMAIYWMMALNDSGRETHAHYKLMWQAIYDLKISGVKIFNMGATPSITDTVIPWKESWGSKIEIYYIYMKIPLLLKPILKIKEILYG